MNLNFLKRLALSLFLVLSLAACQEIKSLLGIKDPVIDFPPGEYIGKAKLISQKGANGENLISENASALTASPTTTQPITESKTEEIPAKAEEKKATTEEGSGENLEMKNTEAKPEETGVLKEVPALIDPFAAIPGTAVKITFLPRKEGFTDGVGIINIDNSSHRFLWRAEGNNQDTWNILFTKDNNIYSNLHLNFNFDGVATRSNIDNRIIGRLYIDDDSKISEYYIEAYQFFKPKIQAPKEALTIKGGDDIVIDVEKAGDNPEELKAILLGIPSEKQQASINELKVKNIEYDPKKEIYKVYIMTSKSLGKGEYSLYLIRSAAHKSNSIPIKI